jgi:uncharacterized membrane protein YccC
MNEKPPLNFLARRADHESLQPDLGRAIRATVAFMVPLLLAYRGWLPIEVSFVALAAQNIAMVDVRGAYRFRLGLLLAMTAVFVGAAGFGGIASHHFVAAVIAMGVMAVCSGLWRHLSSDYGMSLAISSMLVFLIAVNEPRTNATVLTHVQAVLIGGLWGVVLQVINWPFRPQHPLRRTVADSWLAVADLFEAMNPKEGVARDARERLVQEREAALRTTLDRTYAALDVAGTSRPNHTLHRRLDQLHLTAARLATRVVAFNTALEGFLAQPAGAALVPALQPSLTALTNLSRTVGLAVVSRQPAHLATVDVRLRRVTSLLRVLQNRLAVDAAPDPTQTQLVEILRQIEQLLPEIGETLRATIDRAGERAAFSLELFDIDTWTLRPLASALNFSLRVDPALVRFTLRLAVLTMAGLVIVKKLGLPHGYWLPFTMVVVLQPDYGSTRQRATHRVLGTLAGSIVASGLLWLHLPYAGLALAMTATIFAFAYMVRHNYGIAVFFVTIFIVLLTEANGPVTIAFTAERLASTLTGGTMALLAALFFWPVWEKNRFPPLLAQAIRSNRDYLRVLAARLDQGGSYDPEATAIKRRAETDNSTVFSSLQRMIGDPANRQEGIQQAAALANGNQRLTRALTVITLHLTPGRPANRPEVAQFAQLAGDTLETLAVKVEHSGTPDLEAPRTALENFRFPPPDPNANGPEAQRDRWVFGQLTRAATELSAMLLAAGEK